MVSCLQDQAAEPVFAGCGVALCREAACTSLGDGHER